MAACIGLSSCDNESYLENEPKVGYYDYAEVLTSMDEYVIMSKNLKELNELYAEDGVLTEDERELLGAAQKDMMIPIDKKIRDAEAKIIVRFGIDKIYMIVEKENHWILDKHVNDSRDVTSEMIEILKERTTY